MKPQLDEDIQTAKKIVSFFNHIDHDCQPCLHRIHLFDGDALTGYRPGDAALESQEVYRDLIQVDEVNLNGAGVTVCIVDSGLNPDHQDLDGLTISKWQDFVGGANNPYDDHGHGTSMAGILVADGWMKGIAPKVELLVAKALAENGQVTILLSLRPSIGVLKWSTHHFLIAWRRTRNPTFQFWNRPLICTSS